MKTLHYYYMKYKVVRTILYLPKFLYHFYKFDLISDENFIKSRFKKSFGYELDLNNPITFNEKLQWLKLNDRTDLHTICADKYAVRKYVEEKIGKEYLIPNYLNTKEVKEIVPDNLPDIPFIIKTNHDSGTYFIIRDKQNKDWKRMHHDLKKSLRRNYYKLGKEWQYKNIEPQIIVERLLISEDGKLPNDYKFHCINGKVEFIQVDIDRQNEHRRNIYDRSWKLLDCELHYRKGQPIEAPFNLTEMIKLAEVLAESFCFARVDFYEVDEIIYFGEITFHPESGFGEFKPNEWDSKFGSMLKLPIDE